MEAVTRVAPKIASVFATTRWSVIAACKEAEGARARAALTELCRSYWKPVYACIRHHGHTIHDAQDLTQDFFLQLLSGKLLDQLNEAKGRFRAYLSTALRNFLHDQHRRRWTLRRGRGTIVVPLENESAENCYARLATAATPESLYERQWAQSVIEHTLNQLRIELRCEGKEELLDHLNATMAADKRCFPYAEVARALEMTVGTLHVSLHRCRRRFQVLLRAEIGRTVTSKSEIDDELRYLQRLFGRAV